MQIVIDISDEKVNKYGIDELKMSLTFEDRKVTQADGYVVYQLPKGHGDLIDVCEFSKYLIGRDRSFQDLLKLIPVVIQSEIIETDKGE